MKIVDRYDDDTSTIYTVQIADGLCVDVKHVIEDNYFYVMDLADGKQVYNEEYSETDRGVDYPINENEIVDFVKNNYKLFVHSSDIQYICQIAEGYMLARGTESELVILNTGYPYPDTPKSNAEMMQDLIQKDQKVLYSVEFYQSVFPDIKKYLLSRITEGNFNLSIKDVFDVISKTKK